MGRGGQMPAAGDKKAREREREGGGEPDGRHFAECRRKKAKMSPYKDERP